MVADIASFEVKLRMATALEPADGEESIKCCVPFQVCQASYMVTWLKTMIVFETLRIYSTLKSDHIFSCPEQL